MGLTGYKACLKVCGCQALVLVVLVLVVAMLSSEELVQIGAGAEDGGGGRGASPKSDSAARPGAALHIARRPAEARALSSRWATSCGAESMPRRTPCARRVYAGGRPDYMQNLRGLQQLQRHAKTKPARRRGSGAAGAASRTGLCRRSRSPCCCRGPTAHPEFPWVSGLTGLTCRLKPRPLGPNP